MWLITVDVIYTIFIIHLKVLVQLLSKKFHNMFYNGEIRADRNHGAAIRIGIYYKFIIDHIPWPYCQENLWKSSQRDVWYI